MKIGQKHIELSYIAGFFDGEGCTCAFRRNEGTRGHGYSRCNISIINTNKSILEWIASVVGGKVYYHSSKYKRKRCYTLHFSAMESYNALLKLYPYLQDKQLQAEVALEFLEYRFTNCNRPRHQIDDYYIQQLRELKK